MKRAVYFILTLGLVLALGLIGLSGWAIAEAAPLAPLTHIVGWIAERQRAFYDILTEGLRSLTEGGGTMAALSLIGASLLYGIFHAAGPGHGKAILSTYLLTSRQNLTRGLGLALAAALCQGLVAIALVYGLIVLAGWLPRDTSSAVLWSERLSYALVLVLGVYLAMRAALGLALGSGGQKADADAHGNEHGHGHRHGHGHGHAHGHSGACSHAHGPDAGQIDRAGSLRERVALVLSIGLRPCSGAVLVLVFARIAGLSWAGLASVIAMSLGTALATASLAAAAVFARGKVASFAEQSGTPSLAIASRLAALVGGLVVAAIGFSLFAASWRPVHPLGLG